jgi:hypothetical protein
MRTIHWFLPAFFVSCLLIFGCEENSVNEPEQVDVFSSEGNTLEKVMKDTEDVFGQGPEGPVVAENGATIRRTNNGISFQVQMPTPEPGTYQYPDPSPTATNEVGPPEAFTLWVFIFDDELGGFGDNPWSSAFLGGGHVVSGPNLTLSGQINRQSEPFAGFDLENPREVVVHLAVAPHGALDPDMMPGQIKTPSGPGPDVWWLALFD